MLGGEEGVWDGVEVCGGCAGRRGEGEDGMGLLVVE